MEADDLLDSDFEASDAYSGNDYNSPIALSSFFDKMKNKVWNSKPTVIGNPIRQITEKPEEIKLEDRDNLTFVDRVLLRKLAKKTGYQGRSYTTDTVYVLELGYSSVTHNFVVYAHWSQINDLFLTSSARYSGADEYAAKKSFSGLVTKKEQDGYSYFTGSILVANYYKRHPEFQSLSNGAPNPIRGGVPEKLIEAKAFDKPTRHIEL
jgi:hypothetical protein